MCPCDFQAKQMLKAIFPYQIDNIVYLIHIPAAWTLKDDEFCELGIM